MQGILDIDSGQMAGLEGLLIGAIAESESQVEGKAQRW